MASRGFPFGISLGLHAAVLAWVASGPAREAARGAKSLYSQEIAPYEKHIVWYHFRDKLPEVSPLERRGPSRLPKAETRAVQTVVAAPPHAPRANQLVWLPAPQIELKREFRSPNLLAFHAPAAPAPPPKPRLFAPPPQPGSAPAPAPELTTPPALRAEARLPAPLTPVAKPEPRAFRPPPAAPHAPASVPGLAAPPTLAANLNPRLAVPVGPAPARPEPRAFRYSSATPRGPGPATAIPAPPALSAARAGVAAGVPGALGPVPTRPEPRAIRYTGAPAGGTGPAGAAAATPAIDAPEVAVEGAPPGALGMVVVGLDPAARLEAPLPEGARNARFSAGPEGRGSGGDGEPVESARIFVPGLMIRNGPRENQPVLVARAAPASLENLRGVARATRPPEALPPVPAATAPSAAVRLADAPDPRLAGRTVYGMTVQMPNITSYIGSWMIWFAERGEKPGTSGVFPPVPVHKVDPKYVASAAAERVEGKVRLAAVIRRDGSVDSVALVQHLDDRLDRSAEEALAKWHFEPARRDGAPIELDAVIEIPFRLAPRTKP